LNRLSSLGGAAVAILQLLSCDSSGQGPETLVLPLTQLDDHSLSIDEPSGLSLAAGGRSLWVVSGQTDFIYRLDLDGTVLDSVSYAGQDPEGVAFDPADSTLWLVEEREREIVQIDLDGREVRRVRLALDGDDNSGLEGVCVDDDGSVYVLNEKKPASLILLTGDLAIEQMWFLDFAGDVSGMAWDRRRQAFWIVSDQDRSVYLWSPAAGLLGWSALDGKKAEGVAYDPDTDHLYVVRETKPRLYIYELSQAD
jgi:uncharacterized protein YjiK